MNEAAWQNIQCLICDVDGVLTDGKIIYDSQGCELKNFHVQDGLGLVIAKKFGIRVAIISARESKVVAHRAKDLEIDLVYVGVSSKLKTYEQLISTLGLKDQQICFVGDDLADMSVLKRVGMPVAVANATEDVKSIARHITQKQGGDGAVREVVELILKARGLWPEVLQEFER